MWEYVEFSHSLQSISASAMWPEPVPVKMEAEPSLSISAFSMSWVTGFLHPLPERTHHFPDLPIIYVPVQN